MATPLQQFHFPSQPHQTSPPSQRPPSSHSSHTRTHSAADAAAAIEEYKRQLYQHQQAIEQHQKEQEQLRHSRQHSRQPSSFQSHPSPNGSGTPRTVSAAAILAGMTSTPSSSSPSSSTATMGNRNHHHHHGHHHQWCQVPTNSRNGIPGMPLSSQAAPAPAPEPLSTPSIRETTTYMRDFSLIAEAAKRAQLAMMVDEMNNITL